jgi:hypothetical protein
MMKYIGQNTVVNAIRVFVVIMPNIQNTDFALLTFQGIKTHH